MVVGRDEGPFSPPKALEAPIGELGPEPGALLVGVESREKKSRYRISYFLQFKHINGSFGTMAVASQQFIVHSHGCLV